MDKIKQKLYYFIIGFISLIALTFLPMLGSTVGLQWNVPNTFVGWIVWIATKLIIATINVLIFHSFMEQAKLNVKDNPKYIEAREILMQLDKKLILPRSPEVWNKKQYTHKATSVFISTALATIALTQAILAFDWVSMLSYLFTIIMGLIFGVMQMKTAEEYWTDEFWRYAIMIKEHYDEEKENLETKSEDEKVLDLAEKQHIESRNDHLGHTGGGDILESGNSYIHSCINKSMVLDHRGNNISILGRTINSSNTTTDGSSIIVKETILQNKGEDKTC